MMGQTEDAARLPILRNGTDRNCTLNRLGLELGLGLGLG